MQTQPMRRDHTYQNIAILHWHAKVVRLLTLIGTYNETCDETCNEHCEHPLQVAIAGGIAGPNIVRCRTPVPAANREEIFISHW
jgi:hypothetical protein